MALGNLAEDFMCECVLTLAERPENGHRHGIEAEIDEENSSIKRRLGQSLECLLTSGRSGEIRPSARHGLGVFALERLASIQPFADPFVGTVEPIPPGTRGA
ncbi:hypothetical protein FJ940_14175 [Mesorhizobium sp. B2-3-7]|nr:hypothetical protein FJ940_14175 [Mesorhizobium sp. B2-3-7]